MKSFFTAFIILICIAFMAAEAQNSTVITKSKKTQKKIYDIQYTVDLYGDSPYSGDTVTVVGIVTSSAQDYDLGYIYIQDEGGGPWSGIFIYGSGLSQLYRGEEIIVFGQVVEISGMTYISVTSVALTGKRKKVVATDVDPADSLSYIGNGWEKWESVLVRYKDADGAKLNISKPNVHSPNNYGDYAVSAIGKKPVNKLGLILAGRQTSNYYSSLWVQIVNDSAWYDNSGYMNVPPIVTDTWMEMDAVVGQMFYSYGDYHLTPRNNDDFININVDLAPTRLPESPLTSVSEIRFNEFEIYPNPASDVVNIISAVEPVNYYDLFDVQGRKIISKQVNLKYVKLDVSALQTGIYVVLIHTQNKEVKSARISVKR